MSTKWIAQQARKLLIAGSAMLAVFVLAPQVLADGTETLGPPGIPIETGTGVIVAGTGLLAQPSDININVPAGATVKQALLYWEGRDTNASGGDGDVLVNGILVAGQVAGGPNLWTSGGGNFGYSYTFRADITGLGLVTDGANVLTIDGVAFTNVTNGAGVLVIIDDGSGLTDIEIRDGNDTAFVNWAPPLDTTAPQTFTFAASGQPRTATLSMFASAVSGTNSGTGADFRPTALDVTVDGVTTTHNNLLDSHDGQEWDSFVVTADIPAGITELTVQLFSEDRVPVGGLPASLSWNAAGLSINPEEQPPECDISVDKTCIIDTPPSDGGLCTEAIAATTLRYIGPDNPNANVTFQGKDHGYAEYLGVNLVSGATVLTDAGQNGYTVDGTLTGDKLGSKTTITINGVKEIIHTSCSAIYVAGEPAPLDNKTPNPPNSDKGDPSPNWEVVNFLQKDGVIIEESNGGGPAQGADACEIPFGGADVTYGYTVSNDGPTSVDVTSVLDDKLGELLNAPPEVLAPGDTLILSGGPVFIDQLTENTVNVSANVSGTPNAVCPAEDSVIVDVEPPPQLSCDDGKPGELVFEYTGEACEASPANPQGGKFTCSGDPAGASPVQLIVEKANTDPSDETINIGDFVTVTKAGDKFDSQTDFKVMQGGQVIQDLSMHLSCSQDLNVGDRFGSLILRIFVPGVGGGGMGGMGM